MIGKSVVLNLICFSLVLGQGKLTPSPGWSLSGLEKNKPREIYVMVLPLSEDAIKLGLTEERIRTKCEVRLRSAGITPAKFSNEIYKEGYLYPELIVAGKSFSLDLGFCRPVKYTVGREVYTRITATWKTSFAGYGTDDYVINTLDEALDQFVNTYLEANPK